jgi:hypothetical protein
VKSLSPAREAEKSTVQHDKVCLEVFSELLREWIRSKQSMRGEKADVIPMASETMPNGSPMIAILITATGNEAFNLMTSSLKIELKIVGCVGVQAVRSSFLGSLIIYMWLFDRLALIVDGRPLALNH